MVMKSDVKPVGYMEVDYMMGIIYGKMSSQSGVEENRSVAEMREMIDWCVYEIKGQRWESRHLVLTFAC